MLYSDISGDTLQNTLTHEIDLVKLEACVGVMLVLVLPRAYLGPKPMTVGKE